ncbi:TlpA family protein disulfide reductase [Marinicella gelatinilytica]|uniref:TlpA family protein disulfide reductase n=1 Tax=Marinicella gelatinilytica TaxID=2996017 RepID=UPI00226095B1|nr:TlpA disulfide reductase family protein [Marinicella gelatinilytica]MCX7545517.1 TlpA disulfide reductase family protein [Marinicella gelatinilytica]
MKYLPWIAIVVFLSACQSQDEGNNVDSETDKTTTETNLSKSDQASDGQSAPLEFSLKNLAGEEVQASDYRGQWLVLNYWATWCAPCRDEIPELVRFQNNHENVQILGIAYEDATIEKLSNFAADFNVNYPLLTMDIYNPPAFAAEGGLGLPTTIVYNPEGMRHKKHMGPIDYKGLQELID